MHQDRNEGTSDSLDEVRIKRRWLQREFICSQLGSADLRDPTGERGVEEHGSVHTYTYGHLISSWGQADGSGRLQVRRDGGAGTQTLFQASCDTGERTR